MPRNIAPPPARRAVLARKAVADVRDPRVRRWLLRLLTRGERASARPAPPKGGEHGA